MFLISLTLIMKNFLTGTDFQGRPPFPRLMSILERDMGFSVRHVRLSAFQLLVACCPQNNSHAAVVQQHSENQTSTKVAYKSHLPVLLNSLTQNMFFCC